MSHEPAPSASARTPRRRRFGAGLLSLTMVAPAVVGLTAAPAQAADVTSIEVTGSAGNTYKASATSPLFAKNDATVTFKVTASADTKCVKVDGAFTAAQFSDTAKSVWTFTTTAAAGDGDRAITVYPFPNYTTEKSGALKDCQGTSKSQQSSTCRTTPPRL